MLGNDTYGVLAYDKLNEMAGSRVNQGSFYTSLDRLIEKGIFPRGRRIRAKNCAACRKTC
jgi:hypothetical protein